MKHIRPATPDDLTQLEPLAKSFYSSSKVLKGFDMESFTMAWTALLSSRIGVIYLLENEGAISGALGGVAYPDINSGALIATEFFWFVDPSQRGGGLALYRAFEVWARTKGCSEIRMVHLIDSMPEKLDRVYKHLGFTPAEVHYVKEL